MDHDDVDVDIDDFKAKKGAEAEAAKGVDSVTTRHVEKEFVS